ncbi:1-deoxy-D-xylulose-5-phosphate synthase [Vallitalea pronyensis]|uniref:1-deoxy-D-xylulose-5-phosphate synthase n=1 Tax=Vallitalea pronyensis TaxID=1348613 RepID=A0A8J8MLN0_9FIRM|nr:1-deoxy-D-xylulose-5-phosphate synthase [Vallitalea pronyensis]QUI23799.1 1-deoxy-D-xylulose-5-phosphate synthase [Vallitalea pronyensis]
MSKLLDGIHSPGDIKGLNVNQLNQLSKELREYLISVVSDTGGHLSSNLGVVELTLALHYCFQSPYDKLIWDVGHQTYIHKILTGRKEEIKTIRKYKGLSGFPKRSESKHDVFETGHSTTSLSAALGFAKSREILQENNYVVPIIGDGSMTGGMAFEAMNNASRLHANFIAILNDNQMSISKNVGGLSTYLDSIRTGTVYKEMKEEVEKTLIKIPKIGRDVVRVIRDVKSGIKQLLIPGMLFEELGFTYLGPIDGHNISALIRTLNQAKRMNEPVLIHVNTTKGKGFKPAEQNPTKFHSMKPFHIKNGKCKNKPCRESYSQVFGDKLVSMAKNNDRLVAISAAMPEGTGLSEFAKKFPNRFFDVGIAEQHAVTFAAGLASNGIKPVVALYSSFLQRAYDQIIHDVCMQKLPVVFAIDRAGLVGEDGETHQGVFDASFLNHIPSMTIVAPKNGQELEAMLEFAVAYDGPIAIRYPKGKASGMADHPQTPIAYGQCEWIRKGEHVALISIGTITETAVKVAERLDKQHIHCSVINARFIKPMDKQMVEDVAKAHNVVIIIEENVLTGGYGSRFLQHVSDLQLDTRVVNLGIEDAFIEHGTRAQQLELCRLDEKGLYEQIIPHVRGLKHQKNA